MLLVPREYVEEIHVPHAILPESDGTALVVIDLSDDSLLARIWKLEVEGSVGPIITKGSPINPGVRRPADTMDAEQFAWVPSVDELSQDLGRLQPRVRLMGKGLAKGLVKARLDLKTGTLQAGRFLLNEMATPNYLQFRSCPDRRLREAGIPFFPRAIPETVIWQDEVTAAKIVDESGNDVVVFRAIDQHGVSATFGNIPYDVEGALKYRDTEHNHFRWYYELFELEDQATEQVLPVPHYPDDLSRDPDPWAQDCPAEATAGGVLCPSTSYP